MNLNRVVVFPVPALNTEQPNVQKTMKCRTLATRDACIIVYTQHIIICARIPNYHVTTTRSAYIALFFGQPASVDKILTSTICIAAEASQVNIFTLQLLNKVQFHFSWCIYMHTKG